MAADPMQPFAIGAEALDAGFDVCLPEPVDPTDVVLAVANAISARGLAGDVYRAATVRTGKHVR